MEPVPNATTEEHFRDLEAPRRDTERHKGMGEALARRMSRTFGFGMVVEHERDPESARLDVPFVLWQEIGARLHEL